MSHPINTIIAEARVEVSEEDLKEGIKSYKEVEVAELPMCDICEASMIKKEAQYDCLLKQGVWANTCDEHFEQFGVGLGLGKGQKLIKQTT